MKMLTRRLPARRAAAVVLVVGLTGVIAGCAGGSGSDGGYISVTNGATYILDVKGDSLTVIDPVAGGDTCDVIDQAFEDIANGSVDESGDLYEIYQKGTLNEAQTTAVWADEGPGAVVVESDMITLDNVFNASLTYDRIVFVPRGGAQGEAYLADYCERN